MVGDCVMKRKPQFSSERRMRAVRMVLDRQDQNESRWAAITSVADEVGCASETLRRWLQETEREQNAG